MSNIKNNEHNCKECSEDTKYDEWSCKCNCINCGPCEDESCGEDPIQC